MQRSTKLTVILIITGIVVGILLMMIETPLRKQVTSLLLTSGAMTIEQHASYIGATYEEMIDNSDVIFVGKVVSISPTTWNQDSGEYWVDKSSDGSIKDVGLQIHRIKFEISRIIADRIGYSDKLLEITVVGRSPLDQNAEYKLAEGENLIVFARKTELAWRNGKRWVFMFMTAPQMSYLSRDADGLYKGFIVERKQGILAVKPPISLDQLILDVAQRRETTSQP